MSEWIFTSDYKQWEYPTWQTLYNQTLEWGLAVFKDLHKKWLFFIAGTLSANYVTNLGNAKNIFTFKLKEI